MYNNDNYATMTYVIYFIGQDLKENIVWEILTNVKLTRASMVCVLMELIPSSAFVLMVSIF